jgi:uncharacterized Tic20 family protein
MSDQSTLTQDEKTMAGLAHGSILLGLFTSGIGGIIAALVIWVVQHEKSAYVTFQALQALVYQAVTFAVMSLGMCCWAVVWTLMWLPAMIADPAAYQDVPPAGFWVGMILMIVPFGIWFLMILYGLWGAVRTVGGHDFRYTIIGNWLKGRS